MLVELLAQYFLRRRLGARPVDAALELETLCEQLAAHVDALSNGADPSARLYSVLQAAAVMLPLGSPPLGAFHPMTATGSGAWTVEGADPFLFIVADLALKGANPHYCPALTPAAPGPAMTGVLPAICRTGAGVTPLIDPCQPQPPTSLHLATQLGVTQFLFRSCPVLDPQVRAYPQSWTPLHVAAHHERPEGMAVLLALDMADADARDTAGRTPLLVAAARGNLHAMQALLGARADLHAAGVLP